MALARYQFTVTDQQGNIVPNASVTVTDQATAAVVSIFSDDLGLSAKANPFTADTNGFAFFHVADGLYKITVTSGALTLEWEYVDIRAGDGQLWSDAIDAHMVPDTDVTYNLGSAALQILGGYFQDIYQSGFAELDEISTPATPAANKGRFYVGDDGGTTTPYFIDPAGTITSLLGGGGSGPTYDATLDDATGNEVAFDLVYTVNKATSGDSTGLRVTMTDTLSPGTDLLANFLVGASSKLKINSDAALIFGVSSAGITSGVGLASVNTTDLSVYINGSRNFAFSGTALYAVGSSPLFSLFHDTSPKITFGVSSDVVLTRDAAATLALRDAANPQTLRVYNKWTDGSSDEEFGIFDWNTTANALTIGTVAVGSGTARDITLAPASGNLNVPSFLVWASASAIRGDAGAGIIRMSNSALTDFDRLQFGQGTASFPALKRSSAELQVVLADDSGFAALEVEQLKATVGSAAAKPPMILTQADISEEMLELDGTTIGTGNAIEAVGAKTLTTTHFIKVTITGVGTRYIPVGTIA